MSHVRLSALPAFHLHAELCAAPLASLAALRYAPTALDPGRHHGRDAASAFWQAVEDEIFDRQSVRLDEFVAFRDVLWFGDHTAPQPLHAYLRRLARETFTVAGAVAQPRSPTWGVVKTIAEAEERHDVNARRWWRWLSFALPEDLLLAAQGGSADDCPTQVERISPLLERSLARRGFAEVHLHLGAAASFNIMWIAAIEAAGEPGARPDQFTSPGAVFDDGREFAAWLLRAAIARYLLAAFLVTRTCTERTFREFTRRDLDGPPWNIRESLVTVILQAVRELSLGPTPTTAPGGGLWREGSRRHAAPTYAELVEAYRALTRGWRLKLYAEQGSFRVVSARRGRRRAFWWRDPIAEFLPPRVDVGLSSEMRFVSRALEHLERHAHAADPSFAQPFWQAVRVRGLFYRHLVQRPRVPGLRWFIRHYDRGDPSRSKIALAERLMEAFEVAGCSHGLQSLEVRTSPQKTATDMRKLVRTVWSGLSCAGAAGVNAGLHPCMLDVAGEGAAGSGDTRGRRLAADAADSGKAARCELGAVLHFVKERAARGWRGAEPPAHGDQGTHADPRVNLSGYRYADYYKKCRAQAIAWAWMLRHYPTSLQVLRGVDMCTEELAIPNWVMAPLYRFLRSTSDAAALGVQRLTGVVIPPLRSTAHVGEDFVHLLGGLRRVCETIDHLGLRRGDRLGHALALGLDPARWAREAGNKLLTVEERLFDLAWEWRARTRWGGGGQGDRARYIQDEIQNLTEHMFGRHMLPYHFARIADALYDESCLRELHFPSGPVPPPARAGAPEAKHGHNDTRGRVLEHVRAYLTDSSVFLRGQRTLAVDPDREIEALQWLHAQVREHVAKLGLIVEVNPTSNLLIANLAEIDDHPLWRLNPVRPGSGQGNPIAVCIGADDPAVFASDLLSEYQLLYDAMAHGGLGDAEARRWIENARAAGLDARFTVPWHPDLELKPGVPLGWTGPTTEPP